MITQPDAEHTLMTAKELADHTGIALSVIYAARTGGFPMPARQATPAEFHAWLAQGVKRDAAGSIDHYDALRTPKELIGAAKVARSYFFSARRCGFQLDATGRNTVRAFRAWLQAHPDFRAEHGYGRAAHKRKGKTPEKCADALKLPSGMRLSANPPPLRPRPLSGLPSAPKA